MSVIPEEINDIFEKMKEEIKWLHSRWIIYRQLFGISERRVELLYECATVFAYIIKDVLFNEVQVTLSKLTDQVRSGKFDNLSLEQLQTRIEAKGEGEFAVKLRKILNELKHKCQPFRTRRNKMLAHLDLTTAMSNSLDPLPGISRKMIEEALQLARKYMNAIEGHYCDSETGYQYLAMRGDGETLVSILKHGLRYEELLRDQRISLTDLQESQWNDA